MGTTTRSGFGFGMDLRAAQRDFTNELNRQYGEDMYNGGGNDIRAWLKADCLQKPVQAAAPNKTKSVKVAPRAEGKLVNGFRVTTETPDLLRRKERAQFFNDNVPLPDIVDAFALTQGDAKKLAEELSKKHMTTVHVIPSRLWQDNRSNQLSLPGISPKLNLPADREQSLANGNSKSK